MILINKSTWDTAQRYLTREWIDGDNEISIYTTTTAGQIAFEYEAGGTLEQILYASGSPTGRLLLDIGRDSGVFKARVNGVNVGSETIAGTYSKAGPAISIIGAASTGPSAVHLGNAAYMTDFTGYVPDADMLRIARSMKV